MISCRIFENAVHRVSRSCACVTEDNISLQTFETTRLVAGFTSFDREGEIQKLSPKTINAKLHFEFAMDFPSLL